MRPMQSATGRASVATTHGIRLGESGYPGFTTATAAPVMRTNSAAVVWNTWLGDPAAAQIGSSASRSSSSSSIGARQ